MNGFEVDPTALDSAARALRNGGDDLEAVSAQPSAPQVGVATGAVASALAQVTESVSGIVEGMWQMGAGVDDTAREYDDADARSRDAQAALLTRIG
jgi:methyl-accepting chemotaxis protein